MTKVIATAVLVLAATVSSAFAQGNCEAIFPKSTSAKSELVTVQMPGKANGPAHVAVYAGKDSARMGGSVTNARWCKSNANQDAATHAIVYSVVFHEGTVDIPIASGETWISVHAGGKRFNAFRKAGEDHVQIVPETAGQNQKQ